MVRFDRKPAPRHRLAAILCADVEGYSRHCAHHEDETISLFDRHLNDHIKPVIRSHQGRITTLAGDGFIAEFGSSISATEAALRIQKGMGERNRKISPSKRLEFRIGLNLGEVVVHKGEIFGDGVNVAARVQALARPSSIYVTEAVYRQVKGKLRIGFQEAGSFDLKNIPDAVKVYEIVSPSFSQSSPVFLGTPELGKHSASIAVLPFSVISDEEHHQSLGLGFSEDMTTELSKFRTISVVAKGASFQVQGRESDVRRIGKDLGIEFLVQGSIRQVAGALRVSVQLTNCQTLQSLWASRYDLVFKDWYKVQDEIIRKVVGRLVPRMEDYRVAKARGRSTEQLQAYDYYLRGKAQFYAAKDLKGFNEAKRLLERAIEIDPQYPYPYCYLVRLLNTSTLNMSPGKDDREDREQAWRYAQLAAELDEADPHVQMCLGWCHLWRREFGIARQHFEIAEELNPHDAHRAVDRGTAWMFLGETDRAIRAVISGIEISSLYPTSYLEDLAEIYFAARRYQDMFVVLDRIPTKTPILTAWAAAGYAHSGEMAKARKEVERLLTALDPIWVGPRSPLPNYHGWVMSLSPFARAEDRDHLSTGLKQAGVPVADCR